MKKTLIALSISSLLYSSFSLAEEVQNEIIDRQVLADENMIVTATRSVQDKFDTLASVGVFTQADIEKIQPLSVGDLLSRVAGISISTQGTSAHKSSAFVRGTNSDHVLVLVNGVRVGSATLGSKSLAEIPVQLIQRVEVVKGPRAALWGSDAIGGVIQIFTRDLAPSEGQVGLKVGSNSLVQGYGALGFGNEANSYTLTAMAEKSDGVDVVVPDGSSAYTVDQPDEDGYDRQSVGLSGTSQFTKEYSLELNTQYDQGTTEIDANTAYSGDETSYENYFVLLRNHLQLDNIYLQLGLSTAQDSSEDNYSDYNVDNNFENPNSLYVTNRDQITALVQMPLAQASEITTGFEWYKEDVESSLVYDSTERITRAFFVTGRHDIDNIKIEGSVRYDKVGSIDGETTYQVAAGYEASEQLLFSLSYGTAFKAPSFNDLYYPWSGNPDLMAETSESTEFLTRYRHELFTAELSVYQTNIDNLIEWAPTDSGAYKPSNVAEAEIFGVETTFTADIYGTDNRLTLSYLDAKDAETDHDLPRRPNFFATYNFIYSMEQLDFTFDINYQGDRYNLSGDPVKTLDSYTLVDLGLNYRLNSQVSLLAKITNVADEFYKTASTYPGAERGYTLTLDYRF
ncbi:TonB-dependent receptor domain-containing protein [Colwellia echini]|uniref:TonB-dependent receptor n=1 Tax=Colwellia echini TaxID=1982103 RepID=A0ABY3MTA6_9GAMM|nr:TonB-dependent receptor [Colwellia echini]TYK64413.1 TonB-dependent receptor [Colwellia echini]